MVSADNLPYDVLPLIFHYLSSGTDLVSVSLVSKSFSSGVLPLLYETINVRMDMAKRLSSAASPFHTLLKNSFLQPFVRTIAIHAIPFVRQRPSPAFLLDLCKLLPKLKNLSSFAYTVPTLMALFPPMLPGLVANHNLKELKIMGEHVGSVQAELLTKVGKGKTQALSTKKEGGLAGTSVLQRGEDTTGEETPADTYVGSILPKPHGLEKLWIKSPSPSIMYRLETWVEGNKDTLKSLCILDAPTLSTGFLRQLVTYVPHLTALTMTQCPEIDHWKVLEMLEHLPELKSLCLNVMGHTLPSTPSATSTSLKHFRCLFLISQAYNSSSKLQTTFNGLLAPFHAAALESVTFEAMDPTVFPLVNATSLAEFHGKSLKRLNLLRILTSKDMLDAVCKRCECLEQLCLDFGQELKSPINWMSTSLSSLHKLHTLVDARSLKPHHDHGGHDIRLTANEVSNMARMVPSLRRVINANRCWNISKGSYGDWVSTASRINPTSPPIALIRDS